MNYELPANLQHTAAILQMSMAHHPSEKAPILPAGLFEDLSTRFLAKQPTTARNRVKGVSATENPSARFDSVSICLAP